MLCDLVTCCRPHFSALLLAAYCNAISNSYATLRNAARLVSPPALVFNSPAVCAVSHPISCQAAPCRACRNLHSLILNNNQLTALPFTLCNLGSLTEVNVAHNQIASLPPHLHFLQNLHTLDLSHNRLTEMPWQAAWLPLTKLALDGNQELPLPAAAKQGGLQALLSYLQVRHLLHEAVCCTCHAWVIVLRSWDGAWH